MNDNVPNDYVGAVTEDGVEHKLLPVLETDKIKRYECEHEVFVEISK